MSLNLRQIEVFRAVMIAGSISGAAQLLLISQPAVSRMLSHSEQRIGFRLFERVKGRLYPSPEARRLFRDVEHVYRDVQRVNSTLNDLVQRRRGVVRLVCSPSLGHQLVPRAIAAFRHHHQQVRVSLECARNITLRDRLLDHQADMGISLFPVDHPNLEISPLFRTRLVGVCHRDHPLAGQKHLDMEALSHHPLIGYGAETPFGRLVKQLHEAHGMPYQPAIEVDSPHYACGLVRNRAGIALVDEFSLHSDLPQALCRLPLAGAQTTLEVNLVHPRSEPLSQLAQVFIGELEAVFRQHFASESDTRELDDSKPCTA